MTYKLIKADNYLLVVDDSEIKRCYWFYLDDAVVVARYNESKPVSSAKKIIAHLPLNGSSILEGVPLLPPYSRHQEDGIEELAQEWCDKGELTSAYSFKAGYNKAREKYKYTEEDMRKALLVKHDGLDADYVIEVISNKYPTEFDTEDVLTPSQIFYPNDVPYCPPKTITTAQGVQWVGKYK